MVDLKRTYTEQIDKILAARYKASRDPGPGKSWIAEVDRYDEIQYSIETDYDTSASFSIEQLPGCCGVAVSHDFNVPDDLWPVVNKLMQQLAYDADYTLLVCTQRVSHKGYVKAMNSGGWERREFKSRGTGNRVSFDVIQLKDTGTKIGRRDADDEDTGFDRF